MPATAFTAISSFEMVFLCKNDEAFRAHVVIIRFQIFPEHYSVKVFNYPLFYSIFELILRLKKLLFIFIVLFLNDVVSGQNDTASARKQKHKLIVGGDTSLLFTGTRIVDREDSSDRRSVIIGGYVSAYYAYYTDETTSNGFVQFPTMAPRNNELGLNLIQLSMQYRSKILRSNITLHYGDIPESTWPRTFNLIQEAHAGIRLVRKLWLDAGFFKSHIGLESTQPRENITSSMSVLDYYEPYYLSGAKLTYEVNSKLNVQLNVFDGFNEYIEDNHDKAMGLSVLYDLNSKTSITYNFMTCDETPDYVNTKHRRYYNDLYATFKAKRFDLGIEANYGWQEHSSLKDSSQTASLFSGLVVAKYMFVKKLSAYGRVEYFSDPDGILSKNENIGDNIMGGTFGFEYKPAKNAALSVEGRCLQADNLIFREGNFRTNQRYEFILCMDVWF